MGLPIIGIALSVVGSLVQASMSAQAAKYEAEVQNNQLKVDRENERIRGMQEENNRLETYKRLESTNRVASAVATLGGRNYSYEQGVAPYNKTVTMRDVATIGFNSQMEQDRMSYQIKVNKYNAKTTARMAMVGAVTDSLSTIGSYVSRPGGLLA
jgi:murein L,D-transpeptidase YcbB/YkuD